MTSITLDDMLAVATPQDVLEKVELTNSPVLDQLARSCAKVTKRPHVNIVLYSADEVYTIGSYNPVCMRMKRTLYGPILHQPIIELSDFVLQSTNSGPQTIAQMKSFTMATINVAGETVGGISVHDYQECSTLTESQKDFLIQAAQLAACVIETKARLKTTLMNAFSLSNF